MTSSSKFVIIFATFAFSAAIIEAASKNQDDSEVAQNPKFNLPPRIGGIPALGSGVVAPPLIPKLPGNLGINGNRWGASLLPPLENVLGGLISGIPLIPVRHG
uniref:Uncharacterized protein n=1 Tax=Panagrolaimus superbus TaxID=310955 RepID=A0A914Z0W9_9BILA